jgi:hypothetical protein
VSQQQGALFAPPNTLAIYVADGNPAAVPAIDVSDLDVETINSPGQRGLTTGTLKSATARASPLNALHANISAPKVPGNGLDVVVPR